MKTIDEELREITKHCDAIFTSLDKLSDIFSNQFVKYGDTDSLYSMEYCTNICEKILLINEWVSKIHQLNN